MVDFQVIYFTEYNELKKVTLSLPGNAEVSGACARDKDKPLIRFSWGGVKYSIFFSENEFGNIWRVSNMTVEYSLDGDQFPESRDSGTRLLRVDMAGAQKEGLFASPVDKAYFCTSEQDLDLVTSNGLRGGTVILWNLHLQPYVTAGQFGPSVNCPGGKVGRRRVNQNVPLAVGSTLAAVAVVTVAGYALWRHIKVKKFSYDTME